MPGPSLLARKKKRRAAGSKKSKVPVSPPSPPYEPPSNAPVRQLQPFIKYAWRVWWNDWIGDPFLSKKKNRGDKNGAKGWVREQFCGAWWDENLSGIKASKQDKLWYFDHTKVGEQIYAYLHNSSVRGSKGRDPKGPLSNKVGIKRRTAGHDFWRRENPDLYEEEVEKWKTQNKREPNFGELRKISGLAFNRCSRDEKDRWNQVAKEALKGNQVLAKLTEPGDHTHADYYDGYGHAFDTLMADGEKKANIRVCAFVLHEKHDGGLKVDWKISEGLQGFTKSDSFAAVTRALQEWIEETTGKTIEDSISEVIAQSPREKPARRKNGKGKQCAGPASDDESRTSPGSDSEQAELFYDELDQISQYEEDTQPDLDDPYDDLLPRNRLSERDGNDDLDVDELELRRRYGFTWVNTLFESYGSDSSHKTPINAWTHSDRVFGQFGDLPPYKSVSFHTPKALVTRLHAIVKSCREAIDELYEYLGSNPRIPSKFSREARSQAEDHSEHQALYQYIMLCRAVWNNAAQVAVNGIFGHGTYIALIAREAAQARQLAQTALDQGVFPDSDVGPTEVADAVRSANEAIVELQWTFDEFHAFQQLATKWYNNLQGNWLYDKIQFDWPTLIQIVQGLLDWADETTELITRLWLDRELAWGKHVGGPFEPKHTESGMLYRFGCPSVMEEPAGLRDAFQRAQATLSSGSAVARSMGSSEKLLSNEELRMRDVTGDTTPSTAGTFLNTPLVLGAPGGPENSQDLTPLRTPIMALPLSLPIPKTMSSTSRPPIPATKKAIKRKREADLAEAPPKRVYLSTIPTTAHVKLESPMKRKTTEAGAGLVRHAKRVDEIGGELKNRRTGRRNAGSKAMNQ
ncbi:unnamed protein product [Rhizoctonia solani]|uniref:Uncharacterized protein n=3 Tax=Rhizoctonia solani TaxID=456999 RepID=A0A8H2WII3_9AGAM|nr:hypothetical protein RSOL_148820 [Rhizoctonia solani AG-3 Rhs1AP]KEP45841.1 hypothetical protein V565_237340 [Rhizoctonia solani 123E]CAE6387713.1 unnamed protein product [Rhizoctonia solani]CAE6427262.1 unnamed protein product [Rhizoctonia solani]